MTSPILFKRSSSLNSQPDASTMVDGEILLNYNAGSSSIFFKNTSGTLVSVGPALISANSPASPTVGSAWLESGGPWLNIRGNSSWYRTESPGTNGLVLDKLVGPQTPLHIWSTRQWVSTPTNPKLGTSYTCTIQTANAPLQQIYVPASTNNSLQNSWPATLTNGESDSLCMRIFDQCGNRPLLGNVPWYWPGGGVTLPPYVGSLLGPVPTNVDNNLRYFIDWNSGLTQETEQGPAIWVIAQFNLSSPNSGTGQIVAELWSSNSTFGAGSISIQRGTGSNMSVIRQISGSGPNTTMFNNINCNTTQNGKNTLLFLDRGTGNVQYSINGGAMVDGPSSANSNYVVGDGGVNWGGAEGASNNRNLNSAICTMAYWVGTTANCPSSSTMQSISSRMHSLI